MPYLEKNMNFDENMKLIFSVDIKETHLIVVMQVIFNQTYVDKKTIKSW